MEETTYQELILTLNQEYVEFIADFVANIYGDGVELGDGKIIIRSENDLSFVQDAVESLVATLGSVIDISFQLEEKKNIDWIKEYQDSIQPIEAGEFYIYPSWFKPKEGKINIKIDPALAFGSGHHATTFGCLEAISNTAKGGERVLDVGCGSGILGLACTKLGALVELCDTDPLSIKSTKENFILNEALYANIWEGSADKAEGEYDIVIANIIADVLKFIASDLKNLTKSKGTLILSGILDTKLSSILDAYSDLELVEQKHKDEWVTLIYHKETDVQPK